MKVSLSSYSEEEKKLIVELFKEGYSPEEISILLDLSFQEIIFALKKLIRGIKIKKYVSQYNITDERVIFLSDTHAGSELENFDYVKETYAFGHKEQIKTYIHGGDFLQGTVYKVQERYNSVISQTQHVVNDYPYYEETMTHILFGNHELMAFLEDPRCLELLKTRPDFNLLGFKRAYLTWLRELISVYHPIKKWPLPLPILNATLNVRGHSHYLYCDKQGNVLLPPLCDDTIKHPLSRPGFIVGTQTKDKIELESYFFKDSLRYGGKILSKKL